MAAGIVEKYKLNRRAEQTVQIATNEIRYIYTGGHAYTNLMNVHSYLFKSGHGFDVKRGVDGSIIFLVGPYDTGAKNFKDSMAELGKFDNHIKLLTREQAAEWRK